MLSAITLIISVGLMIGGVILSRKEDQRGVPLAAIGAITGITIVVLSQLGVFDTPVTNEDQMALVTDNASRRLGRYLAEAHPNSRVVIIKPYELIKKKELRDAMVNGLTEEIKDKMTVVKIVQPELPEFVRLEYEKRVSDDERNEAEIPPLNEWFTAELFDQVLAEHAIDCDLVICLPGLPEDSPRMKYWANPDRPKLAIGFSITRLSQRRLVSGDIVAAVSYRMKTPADAELPPTDDPVIAKFNKRYYLVTPDNAAEMRRKQPRIFKQPRGPNRRSK